MSIEVQASIAVHNSWLPRSNASFRCVVSLQLHGVCVYPAFLGFSYRHTALLLFGLIMHVLSIAMLFGFEVHLSRCVVRVCISKRYGNDIDPTPDSSL